jgi:hypothetical protein
MPLPQDIRPAFQTVQDTVVRVSDPWIEQGLTSKMKVISRDSSTWAVLIHWKKGHDRTSIWAGTDLYHFRQAAGA